MRKILLPVLLLFGLSACTASTGAGGTVPPYVDLEPYLTATPSVTPTPLPPLNEIFVPTATPVTYTVQSGDTMSAIALRFNVSLPALLEANPGVDVTTMPIGTVLIIPVGNAVAGEPTPTPAALTVRQVRCWPETSGGLWCFGLVQNEHNATLENLSAQLTLLDDSGEELTSQVIFGLLDILPAGSSMPFAAHFPAPIPANVTPRLQVLTAILLLPDDARYVPVTLQNVLAEMDASGRTAQVSGQAMPVMLDGQVNTLWILGTAYDSAGNVVGVRRWESVAAIGGGVSQPFKFAVYSLGPAIERVELLVEARP